MTRQPAYPKTVPLYQPSSVSLPHVTCPQAALRQQEEAAAMEAQLAEQEAANAERQDMLQEHESRVASLKVHHHIHLLNLSKRV
jgi:hypothetical protein